MTKWPGCCRQSPVWRGNEDPIYAQNVQVSSLRFSSVLHLPLITTLQAENLSIKPPDTHPVMADKEPVYDKR